MIIRGLLRLRTEKNEDLMFPACRRGFLISIQKIQNESIPFKEKVLITHLISVMGFAL